LNESKLALIESVLAASSIILFGFLPSPFNPFNPFNPYSHLLMPARAAVAVRAHRPRDSKR
jgi:hypothetical protein